MVDDHDKIHHLQRQQASLDGFGRRADTSNSTQVAKANQFSDDVSLLQDLFVFSVAMDQDNIEIVGVEPQQAGFNALSY